MNDNRFPPTPGLQAAVRRLGVLDEPSLPGVAVARSPMGGGWAWGLTTDGRLALEEYYGEEAVPIAPLGNRAAYIVEAADAEDLANYLISEGISWEVQ